MSEQTEDQLRSLMADDAIKIHKLRDENRILRALAEAVEEMNRNSAWRIPNAVTSSLKQ